MPSRAFCSSLLPPVTSRSPPPTLAYASRHRQGAQGLLESPRPHAPRRAQRRGAGVCLWRASGEGPRPPRVGHPRRHRASRGLALGPRSLHQARPGRSLPARRDRLPPPRRGRGPREGRVPPRLVLLLHQGGRGLPREREPWAFPRTAGWCRSSTPKRDGSVRSFSTMATSRTCAPRRQAPWPPRRWPVPASCRRESWGAACKPATSSTPSSGVRQPGRVWCGGGTRRRPAPSPGK